ncbi:MAG TPA: PACE efflux transporter [Roseateles sp.]
MVAASAGLALMTDAGLGHSGVLAVAASVIAVIWNLAFNSLFEMWESRQAVKGRSIGRRVAHAIGFEGGLVVILVPLVAWWLDVSLWAALLMDLGLVVFFLVYTFVFNWAFDRVFGLPASAAAKVPVAA